MLKGLAGTAGVIELVEQGFLPDGVPYTITRPFGSLLAFDDTAEMIIKVLKGAASIVHELSQGCPPVLHRDLSIGNLIYHGDD